MYRWPTIRLGDVLELKIDAVPIDPAESYKIAGVYSFGRGLLAREPLLGSETTYKMFHRLHEGDFVMSQLKAWEGALARVPGAFDGWFLSPQFPTFRPVEGKLDISYFDWYCKQLKVWESLRSSARGMGARRDSVSAQTFLSMLLPLPPLEEQRRIVARIEELASKIEEARGLRRQAAIEAEGLVSTAISTLFSEGIEKGWLAGPLGDYVIDDCYGTSEKADDDESGTPILRMGNIQNGRLVLRDLKYLHLNEKYRTKLLLTPGDILVNRTNSAELVGKCSVFNLEGEYAFASYLIRLRLDTTRAEPRLVASYINSPSGRAYMFSERKQMTGQANVNATKLKALPIALPPLAEQRSIIAYLDDLQDKVDALKGLQTTSAEELDALLPSILDKAFKGEL